MVSEYASRASMIDMSERTVRYIYLLYRRSFAIMPMRTIRGRTIQEHAAE